MQSPAIADNEQERLQALHELELLDTQAEERFDRLTRLARQLFDVPIALVSLVDAERQWFKSRQGLDVCETGRDVSFCGHAILGEEIFEIGDASKDPRFADNPLVTGAAQIRFYAGAPLMTSKGYVIGTLCIIDSRPRQLSAAERVALRDLADAVVAEVDRIELQRDSRELIAKRSLSGVIARAQALFIREDDRRQAFDELLTDILGLTGSEYGFIGEVLSTPEGAPYLKTYAITNIAWNEETRAFYTSNAPLGLEFPNLNTLFGAALTSGEPVIANDPYNDPRRGGLPEGHPALNAFLGIPIRHGSQLVAMLGLANKAGGYDQGMIEFLSPLLVTIAQLIVAAQLQQQHEDDELELKRLSRVASQTTNGVIITGVDGRVQWINEGFTRISGYTLDEMHGRKPGEMLQGPQTDPATVAKIRTALMGGKGFEVEVLNYTRDRKAYWIRIQCSPLHDETGTLQGFMAIEADITREKEDARRVRDSEQQYRSLVTNSPGATYRCLLDDQWTMLYMSDQIELLSGYCASDFIRNAVRSYASVIHPDDIVVLEQAVNTDFSTPTSWNVEYRILHRDGSIRWAQEKGSVIRASDGAVRYLEGFIFDITDDKTNRLQVKQQLDAFSALHDIASTRSIGLDDKIERALRLGADYLGLELGIVSCIKGDDYKVHNFVAPANFDLRRGQHFLLGHTYCDLTYQKNDVVAIDHMANSEYRGHPCYESFGLETYIGAVLEVAGQRFGTVNFSSAQVRPAPFNDSEVLFIRLLMRWIGATIETERSSQALQASEARLRGLFELSPIGIALNDYETGAFVDLNQALIQPTGYTQNEFISLSYWDLTPREYEEQETLQLQCMEKNGRYGPYEKEYIRKDGSRYPVLLNGMVVHDASGRKLIWSMVEDISERKQMERIKSEFVSTVSHELRTPLTSISGALGLVVDGGLGELSEPALQMVSIAYNNSQRLNHLINDLLDIEKIAAGKLHFNMQVQPLLPLIEQALDSHRTYSGKEQVALVLDSEPVNPEVRVDSQRLQQVLANLLSNAIKFSPEGGVVRISLKPVPDLVRVTIADQGSGIPETFRDRIFEKFSQADSSDSRQRGGTGLGLAITRELVEHMGGTVGFESVEGEGATFWFELPLFNRRRFYPVEEPAQTMESNAPRILVVEDEPDVAEVLATLLSRAGYRVDVAYTGEQALKALEDTQFEALSLDLMLPDISGIEVIRRVREQAQTANLPIVVVSAKMEAGRLAINGDFFDIDWLAKPVDEQRLLQTIDVALGTSKNKRPRILHVEDDSDLHQVIRAMIGQRYDIELSTSLRQARNRITLERFDVIILDIGLPDGSGWDLLPEIQACQPEARIFILSSADITIEQARKVETVLMKSQVSPQALLDALNARIFHQTQRTIT